MQILNENKHYSAEQRTDLLFKSNKNLDDFLYIPNAENAQAVTSRTCDHSVYPPYEVHKDIWINDCDQ